MLGGGRAKRPGARTMERRAYHYRIETELAARLRAAPAAERRRLYGPLYDELFRRVPDHPQNRLARDRAAQARESGRDVAIQRAFLAPHLAPGAVVIELGAGDAALSRAVAPSSRAVYAVDVSEVVLAEAAAPLPANLLRVVYDGLNLPLRENCADIVFSYQLLEHLHPDDAAALVREAFRVLKPGGAFLCVTPNRVDGPHDISGMFDEVARGFHLKEYSSAELAALMAESGFARAHWRLKLGLRYVPCPLGLRVGCERLLLRLPRRLRRPLVGNRLSRALLPHYLCAEKGAGAA